MSSLSTKVDDLCTTQSAMLLYFCPNHPCSASSVLKLGLVARFDQDLIDRNVRRCGGSVDHCISDVARLQHLPLCIGPQTIAQQLINRHAGLNRTLSGLTDETAECNRRYRLPIPRPLFYRASPPLLCKLQRPCWSPPGQWHSRLAGWS